MDPDKALDDGRQAILAWEAALTPDAEHDPARDMSEAFGALDDWLSHDGFLPRGWGHRADHRERRRSALELTREILSTLAAALEAEGISGPVRERVMNRIIWDDPAGGRARYDVRDALPATVPVRFGEGGPVIEGAIAHVRQDEHGVAVSVTMPEGAAGHAISGMSFRLPEDGPAAHHAEVYAQAAHVPWPQPDSPVFDDDGREAGPADTGRWPLISTCSCGATLTRDSLHEPWRHR
jgi:hypothetical protein